MERDVSLKCRFYLLFRPSRLVATSQSRRRDFTQGLPVATRPDLVRSVRRLIFAAEREGLLVPEFGCVAFEQLGLLGFQPRLLIEGCPSAHQPFVLLDIPSHRVDAPLIPLDFEQLLQFRQPFRRRLALHQHIAILQVVVIPAAVGPPLQVCLLYTSPSPRDGLLSRMPSSA